MAKRTASARKQMRADVDRAARNRSARSAIKTRVVRVRRAAAEHAEGLAELAVAAVASLDRAANKGILHPNNAARRKSRLMKAVNAAGVAGEATAAAKPTRTKAAAKPAGKPAAKPAAKSAAKPATKKATPAKPATRKSTPAKKK